MVYITSCIFTSPEDTTSFRIPVKQNGQEQDFAYLEDFLKKYASLFRSADEIMGEYSLMKEQGILGKIIEHSIYFLRGIKGSKE